MTADHHDESTEGLGGHADECPDQLEAEGEIALARLALHDGDLAHAATHVGGAMGLDPRLPEAHEVLAELAARAGGDAAALDLFPMDEPYIGKAACHAHLLAALGRWDEALGLLAAVMAADLGRPFAHVAWLGRPDLPSLVTSDAVTRAIARMAPALGDQAGPEVRGFVEPFYTLIRTMVAAHPDDTALLSMGSGLARRLGDVDRAISWASQAHRIRPDYLPSVMLGQALRVAGRPDDAIDVWSDQLRRDPSDTYLPVDIAELYAATARPGLGLPWVERVLAVEPDHEKAAPAALGIRYAIDGDVAHLVALVDHLRAHPDHEYAATVLAQHSYEMPWLGMVHSATESVINVLRQVLDQGDSSPDAEIRLSVSMIEPPSALLTFRSVFPKSEIEFQSVGDPDPRQPLRADVRQVWQYADTVAHPAVHAPSPEAAGLIRRTAHPFWPHLPAAYDQAVALSGLSLDDLLGALVHPPHPRDDAQGSLFSSQYPDLWVRAVQTFACLGIAHFRTDEPWEDSTRRTVLNDLLFGPEDWVSESAGAALVAVAWTQPSTRDDVGMAIAERMVKAAEAHRGRPVTILESLCSLTTACPWLDRSFTGLAADLIKMLRTEDG
jgi:tetratricopeptide (TPR) repeat protein